MESCKVLGFEKLPELSEYKIRYDDSIASDLLGLVQRDIGSRQHLRFRGRAAGCNGRADANGDGYF